MVKTQSLAASELGTLVADRIGTLVGKVLSVIEVTGMEERQMERLKLIIKDTCWEECNYIQNGITTYLDAPMPEDGQTSVEA